MAHCDQKGVNDCTDHDAWEKPWSTEDIRGSSRQWTLAGDSGLLNNMQGFAQQMISQTHNMQRDVDALLQECKATDSRVHNVINDFLMLSNTQFVESRVYDEEIQEKPMEKKVEQLEQKNDDKEVELVGKVSLALSLGLSALPRGAQILNDAPEVEEAREYEFDDADKIWKINDPYCDRPLPHVIGTEAFLRDESIGLIAVTKEETDVKDHDREVTLTSVPRVDSQQSLKSLPEHTTLLSNPSLHSVENNSEISEDEPDIFDEKVTSNEDTVSNKSAVSIDFAAELRSKLGTASDHAKKGQKKGNSDIGSSDIENTPQPVRSGNSTTTSSHSKIPSKTANQTDDTDNIFGTVQDEDSPFGKNGLFSSGGGLFDDDDDSEDGLFSTIQNKPIAKKPTASNKDTNVPTKKPENDVQQKPTAKFPEASLFADDDDSDLFATLSPKKSNVKDSIKISSVPKPSSLFDDEEASLFGDDPISKPVVAQPKDNLENQPKKKIMAGARPMIGGLGDSPLVIPKQGKSEKPLTIEAGNANENDDLDWLGSDPIKSLPASQSNTPQKKNTKENESKEKSDELFSRKGEPLVDDLFNSKPVKGKDSSLFDDDDSDDLFAPKKVISSRSLPPERGGSLFEDGNKENKIGDVKKDRSELQNSNTTTKLAATPVKPASLFDNDETDTNDDDLFSSAKTSKLLDTKSNVKHRSKSLFEDEDILFGPQTDSPEVDLFGGASVIKPKMNESSPNKPTKSATVSKLVVDSEEEDLFHDTIFQPADKATEKLKETSAKAIKKDIAHSSEAPPESVTDSPRKKLPGGIAVLSGLMLPGVKASPAMTRRVENSPKAVNPQNVKIDQPDQDINVTNPIHPQESPVVVTFEEPPTLETLHSTNKERIKIQVKRRLPTRKGRQEALRKSAIDIIPAESRTETMTTPVVSSKSAPSSPLSPAHSPHLAAKLTAASPSTEEEDLFSVGGTTPGSVSKDVDGLFASSRILVESPTKEATDIFSSRREKEQSAKITDDKKSTVPVAKTNKPVLLFENDEDIFGESSTTKKNVRSTVAFPNVADDDDDIFKDAVTTQSRPSRAPSKATVMKKKIVVEEDPIFDDPLSVNKN